MAMATATATEKSKDRVTSLRLPDVFLRWLARYGTPIGTQIREDLAALMLLSNPALTELNDPKQNKVVVRIAGYGKFPGIPVYTYEPVLKSAERTKISKAITAIGDLKVASDKRVRAAKAFDSKDLQQRVLAQIRQQIKDGMLSGIPTIDSIEVDASLDVFTLASASVDIEATYDNKSYSYRITVELTSPLELPRQIANGFALALK